MSAPCIHGFVAGQCASCHATDASAPALKSDEGDVEERQGWEIFYVPAVTGWQVRAPESEVVPDSYRSLFLARKAVDRMIANRPAPRSGKRGK
jgi:hypothetical protein